MEESKQKGRSISGKAIKRLRQEQNLTLQQVAEDSGISKTQLSAMEREEAKNPTISTLLSLSEALEMNFGSFIREVLKNDNGSQEPRNKLPGADAPFPDEDFEDLLAEEKPRTSEVEDPTARLIAQILDDPSLQKEEKQFMRTRIEGFVLGLADGIKKGRGFHQEGTSEKSK